MWVVRRGHTRFVVLTKSYAFKFARPGIGYHLSRVFYILKHREWEAKFEEWRRDRGSVRLVILETPVAGILANIREYRLSRRYSGYDLADTLFSIGVLNVQRRGNPVSADRISTHPVMMLLRAKTKNQGVLQDMVRPEQFCEIDGKVYLADCGSPMLGKLLHGK